MCHDEGSLLAYCDGEVDAVLREEIASHLEGCEACRETMARVRAERDATAVGLSSLRATAEPTPHETMKALKALDRPAPVSPSVVRRVGFGRIAAAAALLLIALSFSFAPVRSFAGEILQIFRIQKVQTIDLSPADLQQIQQAMTNGEGHISLKSLGDVWIEGGQLQMAEATLEGAQAAVDFPIVLPEGAGKPSIQLQRAATVKFKLNVAKVNEALDSLGAAATFPADIDGKTFTIKVPAIVMAGFDGDKPFTVAQARSPELIVPDGVDAVKLRSVLIDLPFLPEDVRRQLSEIDDWQHTMLIPNVAGNARDITIAGVPAVVITPSDEDGNPDPTGQGVGVVWNQDGVIRSVLGASEQEAVSLAEKMIR